MIPWIFGRSSRFSTVREKNAYKGKMRVYKGLFIQKFVIKNRFFGSKSGKIAKWGKENRLYSTNNRYIKCRRNFVNIFKTTFFWETMMEILVFVYLKSVEFWQWSMWYRCESSSNKKIKKETIELTTFS